MTQIHKQLLLRTQKEASDLEVKLSMTNEAFRVAVEENKRYCETLEFYANEETYYIDFKSMAGMPIVCADNGAGARKALEPL